MLLSLAQWLQAYSPEFGFMRGFQYITFRAVMAALKMSLRPRTYLAARHRTSNVEAYNQLLLGIQLWNAGGTDNVRRALEAYKKAAALDPGCASAFAWAARAEFWIAEDSETGEALFEARRKALASADRAVAMSRPPCPGPGPSTSPTPIPPAEVVLGDAPYVSTAASGCDRASPLGGDRGPRRRRAGHAWSSDRCP